MFLLLGDDLDEKETICLPLHIPGKGSSDWHQLFFKNWVLAHLAQDLCY